MKNKESKIIEKIEKRMYGTQKKRVTIYLSYIDYDILRFQARESDRTISNYISHFVCTKLKEDEKERKKIKAGN